MLWDKGNRANSKLYTSVDLREMIPTRNALQMFPGLEFLGAGYGR